MKEKLNEDFLEFIGLLEGHEIEYLLVGGYAVGIHGFPRYTGDIDFFVAIHPRNACALVQVFDSFGFGSIGLGAEDFLLEQQVVGIGREPRKIQILTGIDGVDFAECFERRIEFEYEGRKLKVIGRDDLIRNKLASGRPKDLLDVEALRRRDND